MGGKPKNPMKSPSKLRRAGLKARPTNQFVAFQRGVRTPKSLSPHGFSRNPGGSCLTILNFNRQFIAFLKALFVKTHTLLFCYTYSSTNYFLCLTDAHILSIITLAVCYKKVTNGKR